MNANKTKEGKGGFIKNLTVGKKISFGFGIVLALLVLSIMLSLFNISNISNQINLYGKYTVPNAEHVRSMQVNMHEILNDLLEAILAEDVQSANTLLDDASNHGRVVVSELDLYKNNQRNNDRDSDIEKLKTIITEAAAERAKISDLVLNRSDANLDKALNMYNDEYKPRIEKAIDILLAFSTTATDRAVQQSKDAKASSTMAWIMLIACAAVSVVITIIVVTIITKSILTP